MGLSLFLGLLEGLADGFNLDFSLRRLFNLGPSDPGLKFGNLLLATVEFGLFQFLSVGHARVLLGAEVSGLLLLRFQLRHLLYMTFDHAPMGVVVGKR